MRPRVSCSHGARPAFAPIEDAKKRDVLTGGGIIGSASEMYPSLANALLGTRFKLVLGY